MHCMNTTYPSDLTDAEWEYLQPYLHESRSTCRTRCHSFRRTFTASCYGGEQTLRQGRHKWLDWRRYPWVLDTYRYTMLDTILATLRACFATHWRSTTPPALIFEYGISKRPYDLCSRRRVYLDRSASRAWRLGDGVPATALLILNSLKRGR